MIDIAQELHRGADPLQWCGAHKSREDVVAFEVMDAVVAVCRKYDWYTGGGTNVEITEDGRKAIVLRMTLVPRSK